MTAQNKKRIWCCSCWCRYNLWFKKSLS